MEWVLLQIKDGATFLSPPPPPPPPLSLSSPSSHSAAFNLNNKVSPSMLLIIIILAVIFFVSGLLHLLVRFLLRPPSGRSHDETDDVTALQGQLQQLFHLHDAGVDQSFIDGLPVFNYKAIVGGAKKDPFDCAVCLCEFEGEDNLRLLPKCSHAFHMDCIDTWLLSHSTCPLCRASLLSEFSPNGHCSPIVLVLESGSSESSREIISDNNNYNNNIHRVNSHLSCFSDEGFKADPPRKSGEIVVENEDEREEREKVIEKVVYVKLGKFKNVDGGGEGGSSESNADARRCFSMGSFAYVMDEGSSLQVPIRTPIKKQSSGMKQCHRAAVSECGCDSRREFNGFEAFKILDIQSDGNVDNKSIGGGGGSGRESFSVSKIWLRGKKDKGVIVGGGGGTAADSSRRAFSFRFPLHRNVPVGGGKNGRSENGASDDEEIESCNSLDFSQANSSSFGKGTLFWLMGRQNKIVHSSFSSNV